MFMLAYLTGRDTVSFCDTVLSVVVRACVNFFIQTTSPPILLCQIG